MDIDVILRSTHNPKSPSLKQGIRYGLEGIISVDTCLMGDESDYIGCYVSDYQQLLDYIEILVKTKENENA